MKKKVLVVDLDGTLYKINTFHHFIKYLIIYSLANFEIILVIKTIALIFLRGFKIISHSKWKFYILNSIQSKKNIDFEKFVNSISNWKRDISILKDNSYDIKILATAAPFCYAHIIAQNEHFNICQATNFPTSKFSKEFENRNEVKRDTLLRYLNDNNISKIHTLVTDHLDDLPLIKLAINNIIIDPDSHMKKKLLDYKIKYQVLS